MDQISFHYDTVLSDVHMHRPSARHLMTRLNAVGQPIFRSTFRMLAEGSCGPEPAADQQGEVEQVLKEDQDEASGNAERQEERGKDPELDEDGDLEIRRRPRRDSCHDGSREEICPVILTQSVLDHQEDHQEEGRLPYRNTIRIEHTLATPLEDVGKQVWRGSLLLADFILSQPLLFSGATILEMGAGTGLTSIVMATTAKTVYCTDVGDDLLSMCRNNMTLNQRLMEATGGEVKVRRLDWLEQSLCTDPVVDFSWEEEEVVDLHENTTFIVAADVCYDDDLTDGFFRTLYNLCSSFSHSVTILISVEKRMNFTLRHMDVSCDAYNHFRLCLFQLQELQEERCSFTVKQVPVNFTQSFSYERIEHLELWKVTSMVRLQDVDS